MPRLHAFTIASSLVNSWDVSRGTAGAKYSGPYASCTHPQGHATPGAPVPKPPSAPPPPTPAPTVRFA